MAPNGSGTMNPERIERQLKLAESELADWVTRLDADKVAEADRRKNAKWRRLEAGVRTLKRRSIALKQLEQRESDAAARKAGATADAE